MAEIIEFRSAADVIPDITSPLGKVWDQPDLGAFQVSEDYAQMDKICFDKLSDYSNSHPTAVYSGKMWKCFDGQNWLLCWYEPHRDPTKMAIGVRKISILI